MGVEIFDANPAAMASFDLELRCRSANRAMTALAGADCVGRAISGILPAVEPIARMTLQSHLSFESVEVVVGGRNFSANAFPVESGVCVTLFALARGLPPESEALFRQVFERSPLGMMVLEWHGQALRFNPAMLQLLGYSEGELTALGVKGITHPDDYAVDLEQFQRLMRGEIDDYRMEKRYRHKDGRWIWGALAVSLARDVERNPALVISTIEDITAKKLAAAERERLIEELREAVRARELFVSIASHELRTPLTGLSLNLQLLQARHKEEVPIEVVRAMRQTRKLAALVETLLDVTRVQRGRMDCQLRANDLSALVKENVERWRRDASCDIELVAEEAVMAMIDPLRIDQVLNNLISNALKFGQNKKIRVAVGHTWLSVSDEGPGVPEGVERRIFDCFERAVPGEDRQYGGLGLGLFIARQIVEAHGGAIRVSRGPGATFTVELKAAT